MREMPVLATDIFNRARGLLNDVFIDLYSNQVMLPFLQIANDDLSDALLTHGRTIQKTMTVDVSHPAGEKNFDLPDDIITPIKLWERRPDQTREVDYTPIKQVLTIPPDLASNENLSYWTWENQEIHFPPALVDKNVRLLYNRILTPIINVTSASEVNNSLNYLAHKTAALTAWSIGGNKILGDDLEIKAQMRLDALLKIGNRVAQGARVRRRPFRFKRMWGA